MSGRKAIKKSDRKGNKGGWYGEGEEEKGCDYERDDFFLGGEVNEDEERTQKEIGGAG